MEGHHVRQEARGRRDRLDPRVVVVELANADAPDAQLARDQPGHEHVLEREEELFKRRVVDGASSVNAHEIRGPGAEHGVFRVRVEVSRDVPLGLRVPDGKKNITKN